MDPRTAVAFVGLNPALLVFEVGGGHNDMLILLPALAGIALILSRARQGRDGRRRRGGGGEDLDDRDRAVRADRLPRPPPRADRRRRWPRSAVAVVGAIAFGAGGSGFLDTLPATNFVADPRGAGRAVARRLRPADVPAHARAYSPTCSSSPASAGPCGGRGAGTTGSPAPAGRRCSYSPGRRGCCRGTSSGRCRSQRWDEPPAARRDRRVHAVRHRNADPVPAGLNGRAGQ